MPVWLQVVRFLVVAGAILYLGHRYLWKRLVRDAALPARWHRAASYGFVSLAVLVCLTFALRRVVPPSLIRPIAFVVFVWLGVGFYLLLGFLGIDLVRLAGRALGRLTGTNAAVDPERRAILGRAVAGGVAVAAGGLTVLGMRSALGPVEVREVHVTLPRLPRSLGGTTIVQLTDLHVGPTIGREFMQDVVARTNALSPDLVAITGDLVDGSVEHLRHAVAPLGDLRARHGVYFVTGNHEYYSGADEWIAELERLGIKVLRNERVSIGEGESSFDLAGVDDWNAAGQPGHGPDLRKALAGRDPSRALVLLAHQPRAVIEAARHGVGLQLSGHTHGGQIWPWNYLVRLQQGRFIAGLAREGDTTVYISRGTGYWGPPLRVGAPAEITKVVLDAPA